MENLGSDVTIEILRKLNGRDILDTCKTSKKLYEACKSSRYNNLWKEKLYEEYKISYNGNNAYDKFVETEKLYQKEFYQVTFIENYDIDDITILNYLFDNEENAIEFAVSAILEFIDVLVDAKKLNYYQVRSILENDYSYRLTENINYEVERISLTVSEDISKERNNYNYIVKELKKEFPGQEIEFYDRLLPHIFNNNDQDFENISKEEIHRFMKKVSLE